MCESRWPCALSHLETTPIRHASSAVPRGVQMVDAIPEPLRAALETSLQKYEAYLHSFSDDETWLKKKVEVELGGSLLTVKQRCSGMGTAWSQVPHLMPRALCMHTWHKHLIDSETGILNSPLHHIIHLFIHSFFHLFVYLFIHSLACVFIHPCMHASTQLLLPSLKNVVVHMESVEW